MLFTPARPTLIAEIMVVEQILQASLTIVEIPIQRDGVDIGIGRRHLAALHLGHATMREQDEDIDIVEATERLDRGRTGIARGGADAR